MALFFRCHHCQAQNAAHNQKCSKCGRKLPPYRRKYFTVFRPIPGGAKKKVLIGETVLEEALIREKRIVDSYRKTGAGPAPPMSWKTLRYVYGEKLLQDNASQIYQNATARYLRIMGERWGDETAAEDISPEVIQDFLRALRSQGDSIYSVNRYLAAGRAAYSYCLPNKPNPFKQVKAYNEREKTPTNELTDEEMHRLLTAAESVSRDLYEMVCVWLSTGLRKENVLHLRRSEVDFSEGSVTVIQKRGRKHTVDVGPGVLEMLKAIPPNGTDFFWLSKWGKPYHVDWRRPFKRALELAGITRRVRFHDLRHTVGAVLYEKTGDLLAVKNVLGHSDFRTTERYVKTRRQQRKQLAEALDVLSPLSVPTEEK